MDTDFPFCTHNNNEFSGMALVFLVIGCIYAIQLVVFVTLESLNKQYLVNFREYYMTKLTAFISITILSVFVQNISRILYYLKCQITRPIVLMDLAGTIFFQFFFLYSLMVIAHKFLVRSPLLSRYPYMEHYLLSLNYANLLQVLEFFFFIKDPVEDRHLFKSFYIVKTVFIAFQFIPILVYFVLFLKMKKEDVPGISSQRVEMEKRLLGMGIRVSAVYSMSIGLSLISSNTEHVAVAVDIINKLFVGCVIYFLTKLKITLALLPTTEDFKTVLVERVAVIEQTAEDQFIPMAHSNSRILSDAR
jgi:hypothetical protein